MKKHQHTYTFTALFVLALILISCNKSTKLTEISLDTDSPLLSKVEKIEGGNLSSIVDSMRFIPLDESQLIGDIKRIRYANGNLYILADDKLFLFKDNGEFVKEVARKGQGPEEVLELNDFDVDSTGLVILDHTKFLFFDINGSPKKSVHNKYGFGRIRLIPGGAGWVMKAVAPTENNHTLIVFDSLGDTIFTAFEPYAFEVPWVQDLFHLNDSVFLNPLNHSGGNELISLNISSHGGTVIPVSVTGNPLSAKDYKSTVNAVGGKIHSPQLCFCGFADNKSQLHFAAFKKGKLYDYVYDKETGRAIKIHLDEMSNDLTVEYDEDNPFSMIFRTSSDNDYFVSWISDPKTTYEQSEKLNPRFKAEYSKLANIDEDSNPVVVLVKFKSPVTFGNENQ